MRKIVAGNWKSQKLMDEGRELIDAIEQGLKKLEGNTEVVVAPPAPYLAAYAAILKADGERKVSLASQTCSAHGPGAHTGEFTAEMLASAGVGQVIIGHSERRERFGETDDIVQAKVAAGLTAGLQVIFCCGEPLDVRKKAEENAWVEAQIRSALTGISAEIASAQLVVAYEPIWAIGTGETASAAQAQAMHAFIRSILSDIFPPEIGVQIPILYGGSCKPGNAAELFAGADVNGGLIGGASLSAEDFLAIIAASDAA
jgi:triosephosphate isomerase